MTKATEINSTGAPLRPNRPEAPALDAKTVLKRAIDAAADRASDLFDGLKGLDAMGEAERVELKGDTLKWLAAKFMQDADEIMTDLDYADHAHRGGVYHDAAERYRDIKAEFAAIDAELIAVCDRFAELEHRKRAIFNAAPATREGERAAEIETEPLHAEQEDLIDRLTEMQATTLDGIRARLRVAFAYGLKCIDAPCDWDDDMARGVIEDVARLLGTPQTGEGAAS